MLAGTAATAVRVASGRGIVATLRDGLGAASVAVRPSRPSAPLDATADDPDVERLLQVARLYRLVLGTAPDRPGLRHHADLLARGSTLPDLAASLLAASGLAALDRQEAARRLWLRAGGGRSGFEQGWRDASGLPGFVASLVRRPLHPDDALLPSLFPGGIDPEEDDLGPAWGYRLWAAEMDRRLERLCGRVRTVLRLFGPTVVLVLRPGPETDASLLDATLDGLSRQFYGRWRLVIDGATPPGWTPPRDPRIVGSARTVTGVTTGTAAATPRGGLRRVLHGVLQPGDVPAPACLALFALASLRQPAAGSWRCDEDRIDGDGLRSRPKLDRAGGLLLRRAGAGAAGTTARHLPAVLLHRRPEAAPKAAPRPAAVAVPSVSLVIATRDRPILLRRCIDSIRETIAAIGPEIVIVDNGTVDAEALALLERFAAEGCTVLRRPGPFNWSALCNAGVRASGGAVAVLMNNDVECVRPGWLERLAAACLDPAVGVAGARLLYPDGRVQHAGVLLGPGPVAVHRLDGGEDDPDRPVSAVTGACMAFRRDVFERLGGLEEALPVTWNDLDFCLRARAAGLDVRLAGGCVLRHDELGTRTPDSAPENRAQLARTLRLVGRRHRRALGRDRFLHPFLLAEGGGRLLDPAVPSRAGRLPARRGVD